MQEREKEEGERKKSEYTNVERNGEGRRIIKEKIKRNTKYER